MQPTLREAPPFQPEIPSAELIDGLALARRNREKVQYFSGFDSVKVVVERGDQEDERTFVGFLAITLLQEVLAAGEEALESWKRQVSEWDSRQATLVEGTAVQGTGWHPVD